MTQAYSRRVSEVTPQPVHAFLKIWVGDTILSTDPARPQFLQGFDFTRLEEYGSRATLTIFDDNWEEIEYAFAMNNDNISIQFGFVDGVQSPRYKMRLLNYNISFAFTGVYLTINAISEGTIDNLESQSITTNTYNPTEAVKQICEYNGWNIGVMDESDDVQADNPYNMTNDNPITYIRDVIIPDTQSDGEIFVFYLDDSTDPPTAHFRKKTYGMNGEEGDYKTYVNQKGYDSVVLSMSFDTKGVFGGTSNLTRIGSTGGTAFTIDPTTKETSVATENTQSVITDTTGEYQSTNPNQSITQFDSSGYTPQQVSHRLYYYIKNATSDMYEAQITIVGDPTVRMLDTIRIINVTDAGYLHHTSGLYMVKGISDSISGGKLTTTLKLQRTGDIEIGLELLNYRSLLK